MAGHHICRFVEGPKTESTSIHPAFGQDSATLYPAAYPSPGNKEKNFLPTGAAARSLKITVLSFEAEVI
jgi:hypothetical protein